MFKEVVQLYRDVGCPPLSGDGQFRYSGAPTETLKNLILSVRNLPSQYGEMSYFREKDGLLTFEFTPISSGENAFFENFSCLVKKSPTLGCGDILENFYITSKDWATSDGVHDEENAKILKVCRLIKDLAQVAVSEHMQKAFYSLVFSTASGTNKPPKTIVIQTRLSAKILELDIKKTSLISSLASTENRGRIHLEERRAILNGAICEILGSIPDDEPNRFVAMLELWDQIIENYWQNFQIYIHSFSFEKVRKEFAQAELDYGSKLSSAFSDIAGKMLALPVSLVAIVTLNKASDFVEIVATSAGLLMASIILISILYNQLLNIQRLNSSLAISFENLSKSISTYPKNLQRLIHNSKESIEQQKLVVSSTIIFFSFLAVAPGFGALLIIFDRYAQSWHEWLMQTFQSY